MGELLKIENISVSYGSIEALHEISLTVNEGDVVALIGANGAGKSTLLKAIMAQVPLTGGSISFDGKVVSEARKHGSTTHQLAAMGLALVPEGRHVFADMTVEENLDMGAFLVKDAAKIASKKEEMYEFFPILSQRRNQKTRSLSGGEQQMMAIARALMSSPRILLLDEPGLGLAPLIVQDIFHKIAKINQEDRVTVLLVEQNARMALKSSNVGYVIETGRIVLSDSSANLLKNEKVKAAYLGE